MADEDVKSIFDLDKFERYRPRWTRRRRVLHARKQYATGEIYKKSMEGMILNISNEIKPLYLPLSTAVDIDAGLIPAGWELDTEVTSLAVEEGARKVFEWSDWLTDGVLYVDYGAKYGLVGLKTFWEEGPEGVKVKIKAIEPTKFMLLYEGDYSNKPSGSLYVDWRKSGGERYEYAEYTTPGKVETYRNGELFGYGSDEDGEFENGLEAVPYQEVQHIKDGSIYGRSTFETALPMLTEANKTMTNLARIIEDHAEPQWAVSGASPADLTKSGDTIWFFPEGGQAKALVADIDISGVIEFIREISGNVKDALPESAFSELLKKKQIATETLEVQLYPLVIKIRKRCRPNYDEGLRKAFRLAGKAGEINNISEVQALAEEEIKFNLNREVLPLDPLTRLKIEQMEKQIEREDDFYNNPPSFGPGGRDLGDEDQDDEE